MKIGLNLLFIIPGQNGGTQTYAESLIKAFAALSSDDEFTVFVSEEGAALSLPEQANFHKVVCPVSSLRRESRYLWEQSIFPAFLRRSDVEILHSLGYVGPLFPPCQQVVTIHDVNFLAIPSTMSTTRQAVLNKMVPMVAHRCARVLTVSEFSKGQIHQFLGVPEAQIIVTHEGPRTRMTLSPEAWEVIAVRHGIVGPYVIAFDSLIGHKNIDRLLEAFSAIKGQVPHQLVLVGHRPPGTDSLMQIERLGLTERIRITGYVPDDQIMPLLAHADLFAFPSLYEGFGLPLLEAQTAGVAVACSTAASIPEVAGAGAEYFNPLSVEDIARVLQVCLCEPERRTALVQKGTENAARFSWERTAEVTLSCYRDVVADTARKLNKTQTRKTL